MQRPICTRRNGGIFSSSSSSSWAPHHHILPLVYYSFLVMTVLHTTVVESSSKVASSPTPSAAAASLMIMKDGGRCPEPKMETRLCSNDTSDQCTSNDECSGESLCCSTGCNRVCMIPQYTACEQVRSSALRRARSLPMEDVDTVVVPECDPATGKFQEIQCSGDFCYCVNHMGFEVPGTRAGGRDGVNCTKTNPKCEGPMCRMLCPHGFDLDENGCEVCECRNVCKGVKCPGSLECAVEQVSNCLGGSGECPPIPACREGRASMLESLCPFGAPLTIPESGMPFLCGPEKSGGPPCPAAFDCQIQTGNDYGVCCAENKNFDKPGVCPVVSGTDGSGKNCQASPNSCRHDLDCQELDKCCFTEGCGKQCVKPANSTICRQQQRIAELLSEKEIEGKGYIPQCDGKGEFVPKQCSRNGKVCWCVGPDGKNIPQSVGPAGSVSCASIRQKTVLRSSDSASPSWGKCDTVLCSPDVQCEFGFKKGTDGCPTCDCEDHPCTNFPTCPSGSQCVVNPSEGNKPTCVADSLLFVNPCTLGTPLTLKGGVVTCSQSTATCPSTHICVVVAPNKAGLCCPNKVPRVEDTKSGMCPILESSAMCNTTIGAGHKRCSSDRDCENTMKCCAAGAPEQQCTVCADPLLSKHELVTMMAEGKEETEGSPITLCQYLNQASIKVPSVTPFKAALPRPNCKKDGTFNEVQCQGDTCWCVDEYGSEIPGTMGNSTSLTVQQCLKSRMNPKCLEMKCRLACDYGYENLDGCRICECRNPCLNSRTVCRNEEKCEMVDMDCGGSSEGCPAVPLCVPKSMDSNRREDATLSHSSLLVPSCPKGTPFLNEMNETLYCHPRARMLQCPDDYFCHDYVDNASGNEKGMCCPILTDSDGGHDNILLQLPAEHRTSLAPTSSEELLDNLLLLSGGASTAPSLSKPGQCPYLIPLHPEVSCTASECETDAHCPTTKKCCLNNCGGTQCIQPLLLSACQHHREILEHKARESSLPLKFIYIPECDSETGEYKEIQSFSGHSWCVSKQTGEELPGTRVQGKAPICQASTCPTMTSCGLDCNFDYALDDISGCPTCACKPSPCEGVRCAHGEECRITQLSCTSKECPPVPLCLPKLSNPCATGSPLVSEVSGETVDCSKSACPSSSYSCTRSPIRGEYAVCCPKPRDVCTFKLEGVPDCTISSWFFNTSSNQCEFGCSYGSRHPNQFDSKDDCVSTCPVLTHCQKMREKHLLLSKEYRHMTYIPSCDANGGWDPLQCFHEVGMCWCVNRKGDPKKMIESGGNGSISIPSCGKEEQIPTSRRRGRLLALQEASEDASASSMIPFTASICPSGTTVHKCDPLEVCGGKVCLAHPPAQCMVDPCGGCKPKWFRTLENGTSIKVECTEGLGSCQREVQHILNSKGWLGHSLNLVETERMQNKEYPDAEVIEAMSPPMDVLSPLGPFSGLENAMRQVLDHKDGQTLTKVMPIYADLGGGNKVMGVMRSSVTVMKNQDESTKKNKNKKPQSIADILADLMSSASGTGYPYGSEDLMPSSSVSTTPEMLPPLPSIPEFPFIRGESEELVGNYPGRVRVTRVRRQVGLNSASIETSEEDDQLALESGHGPLSFALPRGMSSSSEEDHEQLKQILVSILPRRGRKLMLHPSSPSEEPRVTFTCPPASSHLSLLALLTGSCEGAEADSCHGDEDCIEFGMKCCISSCGVRKCTPPIREELPSPVQHLIMAMHLGGGGGRGGQDEEPQQEIAATQNDFFYPQPATMVLSLPSCEPMDGDYLPIQNQGDLSWCVDPQGVPTPGSLTRGRVICAQNGTLLQRFPMGPLCPSPEQTPMVCRDQCLQASCPSHPDAICVMDVCNGCKPTFHRSTGEPVNCESRCHQTPADPGFCRASIQRYTYNMTSGKCESFIFGGCQTPSENNFETLSQCEEECESTNTTPTSPVSVCSLPIKPGPCRASMTRWAFNPSTQSCEPFDYGGCGGNGNNFMSQEHCESRCPDLVLCPQLLDGQKIEVCSRTAACQNITCANHEVSDFICEVEPCSCQATLKDFHGNPVDCNNLRVEPEAEVNPEFESEVIEVVRSDDDASNPTTTDSIDPEEVEISAASLPSPGENAIPLSEEDEEGIQKVLAAQSLLFYTEENISAILLTLVAAISCGLVVFAMFLAFQKKKNSMGCYPKKPFDTLAFSSQVYEIEKKKPLKEKILTNFRVTLPAAYLNKGDEKEKEAQK